jgi:hypothetical protein
MNKMLIIIIGLIVITGCGGGGGKKNIIPTPMPTLSEKLSDGAAHEFSAISFTRHDPNTTSNAGESTDVSSTTTQITYTSTDNKLSSVRVVESEFDVDFEVDESEVSLYGISYFESSGGGTNNYLGVAGGLDDFDYQSFGAWASDTLGETKTTAGVFSIGMPTPESAIPTSGTAEYGGRAIGVYCMSSCGLGRSYIMANFAASVDFGLGALTIATSESIRMPELHSESGDADSRLDIYGVLNIHPGSSNFSGAVITGPHYDQAGVASGRFYGPNAEELGGVISFDDIGGDGYLGLSFGAKQP